MAKVPTRLVLVPIAEAGIRGDFSMEVSTQCLTCVHLREGNTCDAFPSGIPLDIWTGEFDHTQEHEGDKGVRYEKDPDVE